MALVYPERRGYLPLQLAGGSHGKYAVNVLPSQLREITFLAASPVGGPMFCAPLAVLAMRLVTQVADRAVRMVPIYVGNLAAVWTRPEKRLSDDAMYEDGLATLAIAQVDGSIPTGARDCFENRRLSSPKAAN